MAIERIEMTKTLTELFNDVESDKGTFDTKHASWYVNTNDYSSYAFQHSLGFTQTYEKLFDDIKDDVKCFVEFGICDPRFPGMSLGVWYKYFKNSKIYGLDNFWDHEDLKQKYLTAFNNDRTHVFYCDQNKKRDINDVFSQIEQPDIVIEDGSHWPSSIMVTWATVFPYLRTGGWYIIEDLQTEELLKYKRYGNAYDNIQITDALKFYQETGYLHRLYTSKEEHKYIIDHTKSIELVYHNGYMLACIQKK